jgi:hypothetical protein
VVGTAPQLHTHPLAALPVSQLHRSAKVVGAVMNGAWLALPVAGLMFAFGAVYFWRMGDLALSWLSGRQVAPPSVVS